MSNNILHTFYYMISAKLSALMKRKFQRSANETVKCKQKIQNGGAKTNFKLKF